MHSKVFRDLHQSSDLLVLPNAWDAGSARLIESCGAKAIATTSAGVAWSHGYSDGERLPTEILLASVREIVRTIRVPLSVDIEGGYSDDPASIAALVSSVIDAGAVGINIEDGTVPPGDLCVKLEGARKAAASAGVDLFINVRTDVLLRALFTGAAAVDEVIRRSSLFRNAGCDGIFVPGLVQESQIEEVAAAIKLPLNLMLMPDLPSFESLHRLGVQRLSAGSAIAQASMALTAQCANDLLCGSSEEICRKTIGYSQINALFSSSKS